MISSEHIIGAVFSAIDVLNQQLPPHQKLPKSLETILYGPSVELDSLTFVSFIVEVEQQIQAIVNTPIDLTDDALLSRSTNPFQTIGALINYISEVTGRA
jgi:D-alanine--poly(phosphoribitol) ligase subunit 2